MRTVVRSDRFLLFGYFTLVITLDTALLSLPISWSGPESLHFVDALFTATSAV